ncbi:nuclear transport factor 2 family protein [Solitalea sp. MAHUQ-68]|uniref:Nuclear transport factor 2 family protein n=1 Tax=Solitalea agri TaxID=2953739 RepID=A0A9X2JAU6_9SPHI|nr:nuclear transport factor 2 family protein [Solitalea agri]MCO4291817.1 nuclear transport factor 2 family protein [Solitalea agri]
MTEREQLIELANKLFIYTDHHQWEKLLTEVFTETVRFDMSSLGAGEPKDISAIDLCKLWEQGFAGIDAVHHQSGNYLVSTANNYAEIYCYAIASHFKAAATEGKTREFVGSYNLEATKTEKGWRLISFKYNLKYVNGNIDLK